MAKAPDKAWPLILGVATSVDFLSPKAEWAPHDDLHQANSPKAKAILAALSAIDADLPIAKWSPVAMHAGSEPNNIEAVWASIGHSLDAARASKIDRTVKAAAGFSVSRLWSQLVGAGRMIWDNVPAIVSSRPPSSG